MNDVHIISDKTEKEANRLKCHNKDRNCCSHRCMAWYWTGHRQEKTNHKLGQCDMIVPMSSRDDIIIPDDLGPDEDTSETKSEET